MPENDLIPTSSPKTTNPAQSNPRPLYRVLGKLLVQGYFLLLSAAAGGFLGANVAGFIPAIAEHFLIKPERAPRPETYLHWMHAGWLVGAGLFLVGGVLEVRRRRFAALSAGPTGDDEQRRKRRQRRLRNYRSPRSVPGAAAVGSVVGGLLGVMLGGTLLLLWFSLTYSPFGPRSWGGSVSVERLEGSSDSWALATKHPVALYAFFGPLVLGLIVGALFGGIGQAITKGPARPEAARAGRR